MARRRGPRRRDRAKDIDLIDLVLARGYDGIDDLPEERQLDIFLIHDEQLNREWPIRRERLIAEAPARGWPLPLAWDRYGR